MAIERIIDANFSVEDKHEINLRPKWLLDYIGQDKVINKLKIFIKWIQNL